MRKIQKKQFPDTASLGLSPKGPIAFGTTQDFPTSIDTNAWEGNKGWRSPRRWRRKAWIFYGVYTADLIAGIALVDAGYLSKAFCYAYHPPTGRYQAHETTVPFGQATSFAARPSDHWKIGPYQAQYREGVWHLSYEGSRWSLQVQGRGDAHGLGFWCPSEGNERPFHYTYKNMLLPTQVALAFPGEAVQTYEALLGAVDYSKGFPPRHTTWNWTSFMGKLADGTPLGINAVRHFNAELENVLWLGETPYALGPVAYNYAPPLDQHPWTMTGEALRLQLNPYGARRENLNFGVLKSQFVQAYGKVTGQLYHNQQWQSFEGHGLMEEHEARW